MRYNGKSHKDGFGEGGLVDFAGHEEVGLGAGDGASYGGDERDVGEV